MTSKRLLALAELRERLASITVVHGYNTDAGQYIYLGEAPVMGPDDPPAVIAIVLGDEELGHQAENVVVTLPIDVQAIVKVSVDESYVTLEAMVADIKRAVEQADRTLGGLLVARGLTRGGVRSLPREPGSEFVGAVVQYRAMFGEKWGEP